MNSFSQHPRGQISSKFHQDSGTATSLPFSEPWKRQSVVLTGIDPYFGYEFAFPACKASAIHDLAEGLILTALRLIEELTPQQKENSNGIMPMGSTGLTAYIITQKQLAKLIGRTGYKASQGTTSLKNGHLGGTVG